VISFFVNNSYDEKASKNWKLKLINAELISVVEEITDLHL
jgi:hypothetical protein